MASPATGNRQPASSTFRGRVHANDGGGNNRSPRGWPRDSLPGGALDLPVGGSPLPVADEATCRFGARIGLNRSLFAQLAGSQQAVRGQLAGSPSSFASDRRSLARNTQAAFRFDGTDRQKHLRSLLQRSVRAPSSFKNHPAFTMFDTMTMPPTLRRQRQLWFYGFDQCGNYRVLKL